MTAVTLIKLDRNDPMSTAAEHSARRGREIAEAAFRKQAGGQAATGVTKVTKSVAELRTDMARLAADVTSFAVNNCVDEALALIRKGGAKAARELLNDPQTYNAYQTRMAGERWQAPVAKVDAPEPSGQAVTIKRLLETNDMAELGRLMRSDPAAYETYDRMMRAGLTEAYGAVAKQQRDSAPVDASGVEKSWNPGLKGKATADWKRRILAAWQAKDSERLSAMRTSRDPTFHASWAELVAEGKIKVNV
jgi:hypothetical protein